MVPLITKEEASIMAEALRAHISHYYFVTEKIIHYCLQATKSIVIQIVE